MSNVKRHLLQLDVTEVSNISCNSKENVFSKRYSIEPIVNIICECNAEGCCHFSEIQNGEKWPSIVPAVKKKTKYEYDLVLPIAISRSYLIAVLSLVHIEIATIAGTL